MFHDDPPPPLYVPDLAPPVGAKVDAGHVICVVCGARVALAQADIVGQGYRCTPCGQRAELAALGGADDDPALHLSHGDVVGLSASGARLALQRGLRRRVERVAGEGPWRAAMHVARELVEHQHLRKAAGRADLPDRRQQPGKRRLDSLAEALGKQRVQLEIADHQLLELRAAL